MSFRPLIFICLIAVLVLIALRPSLFVWSARQPDTSDVSLLTPGFPDLSPVVIPRLFDATSKSGIKFVQNPLQPGDYFFPDIMGAGVALFDYDSDGRLDVLLLNGIETDVPGGEAPRAVNRLYHQESDLHFRDVTVAAGLAASGSAIGAAIGDVNNDGHPDIYLTTFGQDRLFLNLADGTFRDITAQAGINENSWGSSACFCDVDRDGWLDLYVANYVRNESWRDCRGLDGRRDYCQPSDFPGAPDRLYHNVSASFLSAEPSGVDSAAVKFEDISISSGITSKSAPALGVVSADFNGDRWPDFYVANDGEANFLWINGRDGTFREEAILWGLAFSGDGKAQASMGIALGDVSDDGIADLFLTHLGGDTNTLYQSAGPTGFADDSVRSGLAAPSFPLTGFGVAWTDLDLDGDLDVAVVNGSVRRRPGRPPQLTTETETPGVSSFETDYGEPNQLFVNQGAGLFRDVSAQEGSYASGSEVSRGLACGDLDNDGRPDLVITNAGGTSRIFLNRTAKVGHWLGVRVVEPALGGRDAYGAVIRVEAGGRTWVRWANPAGSYLSSHDARLHFGLGENAAVDRIEVLWPDGSTESFAGTDADRLIVLRHGTGVAR